MYALLAALIGCVIAGMVAINGCLSAQYGVYGAAVVIHLIGSAFAFAVIRLRRFRLHISRAVPAWLYLGGVIGVATTVFNNFSFGKISMTSIVALGLFGQTAASLCIDGFGLFGMPKNPIRRHSLIGLVFAAIGIATMLDGIESAALAAVILSVCAGVTVVLSRTVNAGLSARIGALQGSFINHLTGLPVTIVLLLLLGRSEPIFTGFTLSSHAWIYLGGVLGVFVVLLFNITVPKINALKLTLLSFVGQVFTGIAIDVVAKQGYSAATFRGGVLVAVGMLVHLILEAAHKRRERRQTEYNLRLEMHKEEYRQHILELHYRYDLEPPHEKER